MWNFAGYGPHAYAECGYAFFRLSGYMPVYFDTAYIQFYHHFLDQNTVKLRWFHDMPFLYHYTLLIYIRALTQGEGVGCSRLLVAE